MSEGRSEAGVCRQCGTALIYAGQTICQHCGTRTDEPPDRGPLDPKDLASPSNTAFYPTAFPPAYPTYPLPGSTDAWTPNPKLAGALPPSLDEPAGPNGWQPGPNMPGGWQPTATTTRHWPPIPPSTPPLSSNSGWQNTQPRQDWSSVPSWPLSRRRRNLGLSVLALAIVVVALVMIPAQLMLPPSIKATPSPVATATDSATAAPTPTPVPRPTQISAAFPRANPLIEVGSLKEARADQTATLLGDGRVVIAGGIVAPAAPAASSGSPAASSGSPAASSGSPAASSGATQAASSGGPASSAEPGASGGPASSAEPGASGSQLVATGSVEIFDPRARKFDPAGKLATPRYDHTATLLRDGTILLAGGHGADGSVLASAEVYDPRRHTSRAVGNLTDARYDASAVLLNDGTVFIAGGSDAKGWVLAPEIYTPKTGRFSSLGRLEGSAGTVPIVKLKDGRVLIAGGGPSGAPTTAITIYYPATHTFLDPNQGPGSLEVARTEASSCVLRNGQVLIVGGIGPKGVDGTAEIYLERRYEIGDPQVKMLTPRAYNTVTPLPDGGAIIVGGEEILGNPVPTVERWYLHATITVAVGIMRQPRSHHTATALKDGSVLIVGGRASATEVVAEAGIYKP